MNVKTISTLLSMAFVAVVVYLTALFNVAPLHAASVFIFPEVVIEDGALRPLAQNLNATIKTDLKADLKVNAQSGNASATATTQTTAKANTDVSSTTDLDLYTRTITAEDDNVSNVVIKEDSVAVSYLEPAKFFGYIPTELLVTVEVDDEGVVSVSYPWYAFLTGRNAGELKPGLQLHIGQILGKGRVTATTTTELTPQVRAELIKAIHTALKEYRVNAGATTTTQVRY